MVFISACLAGVRCRFDGQSKTHKAMVDLVSRGEAVFACPEQLGGLPTPRVQTELSGPGDAVLKGRACAVTIDGQDISGALISGAEQVLALCRLYGIQKAYLKTKSPSCGVCSIYDGSFSGRLTAGDGVCASLLLQNGIEVIPVD
ncbi:MAG: DUF523 domain-containing protein [Christensenellales bacterium]|jgi:uncharacterized protein YbbK (DUF523 family)